MEKNLILEEAERVFGKDSAQFKFIIRSIRDFPKGFEMPIRSLEDFEKMLHTLPCMTVPEVTLRPGPEGRPPNMGVSVPKAFRCPHCKALEMVEKLKQRN